MARFIGILVILALIVGAVGYYRGWFVFDTQGADGKTHIGVTFDKEKFQSDEQKAIDSVKKRE